MGGILRCGPTGHSGDKQGVISQRMLGEFLTFDVGQYSLEDEEPPRTHLIPDAVKPVLLPTAGEPA